jgi:autotransporter family porin
MSVGWQSSKGLVLRPLCGAILLSPALSAIGTTTIPSGTTSVTLSTDTSYLISAGTTITTTFQDAIRVDGIAPAAVTNAGTVISSTDNAAAAVRFDVPGSMANLQTGELLGHGSGVFENGGGTGNNVVNFGDISARVSHAIGYGGTTSGTIDNFGTLNHPSAGPIGMSPDGVLVETTGQVTINNHVNASILSGVGDSSFGSGIVVEQGTATVNNDGTITGFHEGVVSTTDGAVSVNNSTTGVIQGNLGPGVQLLQNSTLVNRGLISSSESAVVFLAGSNNTVTLATGSQLVGPNAVMLSEGTGNTIVLDGTGSQGGSFNADSGDGFAALTSNTGSDWTLTGAISMTSASAAAVNVLGHLTLGNDLTNDGGGGTTIAQGARLTLGTGGAGGMVAGDIVNSGTLEFNRSDSATYSGVISGAGSTIQAGTGAFTLSGINTYSGGTSITAGSLIATNGSALGSGPVANGTALQLHFENNSALANVLSGPGRLVKTGAGVATLSAAGSAQGSVLVDAGALRFVQEGAFTTAGNYTTVAGATTGLGGKSALHVGGEFAMNGTLNNVAGEAVPVITASTATIGSGTTFNIAGYTAVASESASKLAAGTFQEIHTTTPNGLSGTFQTVRIAGSTSPVDFLTVTSVYTPQDYDIGVGLTWYASHSTSPQVANGFFTIAVADDSFDMDAVLVDQPANAATGWDGKTLTKAGAGTLQLSKANTYTGATLIEGGTLLAGAANVIASSAQLSVSAGATFDLNGFDQQANNLTGAGNVTLGGAALNVSNTADSEFDGIISGNGSLNKTGGGSLILTGNNTFTGATTIGAGTLQLGSGGTTGAVGGDIVDNGTLVFNRSDTVVYAGAISGTGALVQQGTGSVVLSNVHTYSGNTTVNAGSLVLASGAQLADTAQVTVMQGATFGGYGAVGGKVVNNGLFAIADAAPGFSGGPAGQFVVGGSLVNNGEIRMGSPVPASTLTVAGNYTGNGGVLTLSTALGGDNSPTDRLVVHGDTAGQTRVRVENAGGMGATTHNGIQIIQVDGQSNGVFTLDGRVVAGADEYSLLKGSPSTPDDGDWYLSSAPPTPAPTPTPRPEPGGYLGNQAAAQTMFVHTLHDRAGFPDPFVVNGENSDTATAWARTAGGRTKDNAANGRLDETTDFALVQVGIDLLHRVSNNQRWQAGIMAGYGSATTDARASNNAATASGNANGASGGVYATWHGNATAPDGPYVDTWLQYAHFDNSVKGSELNGENYSSQVWAGSIEAGWAFALGQTQTGPVMLEPQVQFIYSGYQADDHTESNGTRIHSDDSGGLTTRLGVRLFHAPASITAPGWLPFLEVNWWHDTNRNSIAFNNTVVAQDGPTNRVEFKVGVQAQLAQQWRAWAHFSYQQGNGGFRSYEGLFGARYIW